MSDLPPPFDAMLENFLLARDDVPAEHKSVHWDVFPDDYEKAIAAVEVWPEFLRNGLSFGFNDDLHFAEDGRWKEGAEQSEGWENRKAHDFSAVLPETIVDQKKVESVAGQFGAIVGICGFDFVVDNLLPAVGSPCCAAFSINVQRDGNEETKTVRVNLNDLPLIYYTWQVSRAAGAILDECPVIVEIGGGFGSMMAKLKDMWPGAKCILFDLPEVTAVQTYYLTQRFPQATFRFLADLKEKGAGIFTEEGVDFILLPGWTMDQAPPNSVDLAINARSMMEMTLSAIDFYFQQIQRITRIGGLFSCTNRYIKSAGEEIIFKNYPFDERWRMILSQSSLVQPHIHEVIAQRSESPQPFTLTQAFAGLQPFAGLQQKK